jgi:hypothetical protein
MIESMRSPAVGLWLTGVAAAGLAFFATCVNRAAPAAAAPLAWVCDAKGGIGASTKASYRVTLNGEPIDRAVLKRGDMLETDPSGVVDLCLATGRTACRLRANTLAVVLPARGVLLSIRRSARWTSCETESGGPPKRVMTPQATLILGQARRTSARGRATAAAQMYVFSVGVAGAKTKLAVDAGLVRLKSGTKAVDVGCGGKAEVRAGEAPQVTRKKRTVRALWGCGRGTFMTRGRYSSVVVRG